MRDKYKKMYDGIHADDELKKNTINRMLEEVSKPTRTVHFYMRPAFKMAAACLAAVIFIGTGAGVYTVNAEESYVTVESMAQVGLSVNKWNKVINVSCLNEEAEKMANKLQLKGMSYEEAVDAILDYQNGESNEVVDVSVSVKCNDESKGQQMKNQVDTTVEENCRKQAEKCLEEMNKKLEQMQNQYHNGSGNGTGENQSNHIEDTSEEMSQHMEEAEEKLEQLKHQYEELEKKHQYQYKNGGK